MNLIEAHARADAIMQSGVFTKAQSMRMSGIRDLLAREISTAYHEGRIDGIRILTGELGPVKTCGIAALGITCKRPFHSLAFHGDGQQTPVCKECRDVLEDMGRVHGITNISFTSRDDLDAFTKEIVSKTPVVHPQEATDEARRTEAWPRGAD